MSSTEERSSEGRIGPADDRPLNEQEQAQVRRLLSDPFIFPIQFKTWLISFLESSDVSLPMGAVYGLKNILGIAGVGTGILGVLPAGVILPYGGVTAQAGSLLCDGASYLRTEQARLFDAIGTRYGSVDVNHFNVPDLQERIPVGRGVMSTHDAVGKNDGRALGSRGTLHAHDYSGSVGVSVSGGISGATDAVGNHVHGYEYEANNYGSVMQGTAGPAAGVANGGSPSGAGTQGAGGHAHGVSGSFSGSGSGSFSGTTSGGGIKNTPGFLTINFIIVA